MKKPLLLCMLSAAFGAALSMLVQNSPPPPAFAQEPALERVPLGEQRDGIFRLPVPERRSNRLDGDEEMTTEERVNVAVYEQVNRAVVNINTKVVRNDNLFQVDMHGEGAGSGCLLDRQGHILTNNHVIESAREIQVTLYDGKSYEGRLVGKDEMTDIAVVKIDAPPESLHPVEIGDSSRLKVGLRVYAIGNPFGLERTLTTGIISSLNRTLPVGNGREIRSCIQIDAAINPGNSGGPLLNSRGRLIGMNTAIASSTGQSSGVGFAVPSESIARVVPQLIERGKVIRPDAGIARVMQTEQGLIIVTMQPGGPAERAGLQGFRLIKQRKTKGPFVYETQTIDRSNADLIVGVDGQKVVKAGDFLAIIEAKRPGDEVVLTIVRQGREMNVPIRLTAGE
jgi:S1-C subfamily serine protease